MCVHISYVMLPAAALLISMTLLGEFSEAELKRFSIRYENGYDIKSDERYNAWLRRYHPTEKSTKKGTYVYMHIIVRNKLKLCRTFIIYYDV